MDIQVTSAGPEGRTPLLALFELYVYDFSEMLGFDVDEQGRFPRPDLDLYWSDRRRSAFLIRADGKLAGFALVQEGSRISGDAAVRDMDQFFVMRKYRRHRVGETAAAWVFDKLRGAWEVREKAENLAGIKFWRQIIARYTKGEFKEVVYDDERWRGPVQSFDNKDY
jgi:predicted acetyltransferase